MRNFIPKKKACSRCKKVKPRERFTLRKGTTWLDSVCKDCKKIAARKWQKDNIEKFRAYQRAYMKKKYHDNKLK